MGHKWALQHIQGQIKAEHLRHAYLISGPTGVGKRTFALSFAKSVNCQNPPGPSEHCDECRFCRQANGAGHPDLFLVERAEGDKDLKVGAIRSLQRDLSLAPYDAQYRIAILSNFQHASRSASNALLKTLEEPSGSVILILTVDTPETLLPTIVSRCEHIRLRALPSDKLSAELSARGIPSEKARLAAHVSAGRPDYALQLASDESLLTQRSEWLDLHSELINGNRRSRFKFAADIAKDKPLFKQLLHTWSSFWRDVFLRQLNSNAEIQNPDREKQIDSLANSLDHSTTKRFLSTLQESIYLLDTNVNTRMAAEVLLLKMPYQSI